MFSFTSHLKIYLTLTPQDLRKSFNGLGAIVENDLKLKLCDGGLHLFINKINGQPIADISTLIKAFQQPDSDGLHTIEFLNGQPKTIYLDAATADTVDAQLLKRGIPALSREEEK